MVRGLDFGNLEFDVWGGGGGGGSFFVGFTVSECRGLRFTGLAVRASEPEV